MSEPVRTQLHMRRIVPFSGGQHVSKPEKPVQEETPPQNIREFTRPPGEGTSEQINGFVRFFRHFGCHLSEWRSSSGIKQLRGQCPFPTCRKDDHFFANPSTGQWDCKKCQRAGNTYGFIRHLHETYLALTTEGDLKSLLEVRPGISLKAVLYHKLAFNSQLSEWMIPSFNKKNEVSNLHMYRKSFGNEDGSEYMAMIATPTIKPVLYGMEYFRPDDRKSPLYVWEGHWDHLAAWTVLDAMQWLDNFQIVGMPGAGVFPREQLNILVGRDVRLVLDNDEAGEMGTRRVITDMSSHGILPNKLYAMKWPDILPAKFDFRDTAIKFNQRTRAAPFDQFKNPFAFINKNLTSRRIEASKSDNEAYDPNIESVHCTSFHDLIDCCSEKLHMTDGMENSLAYALALNLSVSLGGSMLWGHLIGPPSSGKTTVADITGAAHPYVYSTSKITGIFSGWGGVKKGGDSGMLPKFQSKLVQIKDLTTILSGSGADISRIFGDLRDVYDGDSSVDYRNGRGHDYKGIRFGIMTCVTDIIRAFERSTLGERFLCCEIDSSWSDKGKLIRTGSGSDEQMDAAGDNVLDAICNMQGQQSKIDLNKQKSMCWGLLDHMHNQVVEDHQYLWRIQSGIKADKEFRAYVRNLADWAAMARTRVDRNHTKEISYRPRTESGARLNTQLLKAAVALCVVFQIDYHDDRVAALVRKIALDTSIGFPLEIMLSLTHNQSANGMTKESICDDISLSGTSVSKWLEDMRELGIVTSVNSQTIRHSSATSMIRQVGRPAHLFRLTPEAKSLASNLGFC